MKLRTFISIALILLGTLTTIHEINHILGKDGPSHSKTCVVNKQARVYDIAKEIETETEVLIRESLLPWYNASVIYIKENLKLVEEYIFE